MRQWLWKCGGVEVVALSVEGIGSCCGGGGLCWHWLAFPRDGLWCLWL